MLSVSGARCRRGWIVRASWWLTGSTAPLVLCVHCRELLLVPVTVAGNNDVGYSLVPCFHCYSSSVRRQCTGVIRAHWPDFDDSVVSLLVVVSALVLYALTGRISMVHSYHWTDFDGSLVSLTVVSLLL